MAKRRNFSAAFKAKVALEALADPRFFSSRAINAVQKFAFSSSIRAPRPASRRDLLEIKNLIVEGYRRAD